MTPSHARLRTPALNRELLVDPPFDTLPERLKRNQQLLNTDRVRIGELSLSDIRRMAREELLGTDAQTPLVVTGHQPELFHPGVWVKNFAACGLAQRFGGRSLNLIVDNDTVKTADIKLPSWDQWEASQVRLTPVSFSQVKGEQTWESLQPADETEFVTLPARVAALTKNWGYEPMLRPAWSRMQGGTVGERFTVARRSFEQACGCENVEVPVSKLSRTRAFQTFGRHVLQDLPRFRSVHNSAVQSYRVKHGLRSHTHPVPDLAEGEAPFWEVTNGHRQRVTEATAHENLRPRALALTLFARLCLGDLFIHGIGGGKYDEVTDEIIRGYFGLEPPAFQVLSGTLLLPLPSFASKPEDVTRLARMVRDLHWNPHRYLPVERRVEHAGLRESDPPDHAGRRQRYRNFRTLSEKLRPSVAEQLSHAGGELEHARAEVAANAVLQRRDFSWVLYPEDLLRPFLQDVQRRAASHHRF